ncbi:hypothetical protein COY90_05285 [Candidatus Roizmanbacteria bacterium CG_4_10_14_0_8_um_filter_39_9]|uniref:Cell division protein FtsL n=1 Tax=Candidatus Roizmanbacteria bacterium CG_4_10_14_0_8_um_filter_39_9 TaxID=1974829 RepID=A0A2M7QBF7_9BACT|nr:MAG: hypothetical protein COY90_05285 [Candidatus Roizmanbacteria bacterium CG_4_10_14_0_8_um_filter_39_9]
MKSIFKNSLIGIFILLAAANIYLFVASMYIGDEINKYESHITALKQENTDLEHEVYEVESLQYAASLSASLHFTKQVQPVYFENMKYAFNR